VAYNWGTAVRALQDDIRGLSSADIIRRRLVESIRHNRNRRVYQSEASFSFALQDGVAEYAPGDPASALPADFMEPIGNVYAQESGTSHRLPVERVTSESMEQLRSIDPGEAQTPRAWDLFGRELRVWPTPDDSGTLLEGRYQLDLGIPEARYVSGAWKFYEPNDSATELVDAYTSGWFTFHNLDMVLAYAKCLLFTDFKDFEAANRWLAIWAERVAAVQDETEGATGPPMLEPWP
jgi:hypothetical protein